MGQAQPEQGNSSLFFGQTSRAVSVSSWSWRSIEVPSSDSFSMNHGIKSSTAGNNTSNSGSGNRVDDQKTKIVSMEEPTLSQSLPDTQNFDSQCCTQSEDTTVEVNSEHIWGRLWPLDKLPLFELINDEFSFGRFGDCDVCVKDMLPHSKELSISKIHFRIFREKCETSTGLEDGIIYLKDESRNGTFVNNKLVGKGKTVVLVNNDLIATSRTSFKVYVYMSTSGYDDSFLSEELKDKYAVSRTLGAGACGEVKLCFSKSGLDAGKKYAMKLISKIKMDATGHKNSFTDGKHTMNEVDICKKLKHPCIIKIVDFFDSPSMVYIILELMEGGELFERIKKKNGLSEENAKFIFYQIVLAVNYLHENGITHRDLKPENILLSDDADETQVKVSDFGLSKFVDSQTMMKTLCGTPMYVAPEILITGGKGSYSSKVDVWSLGVILYCCLSGLTPFRMHDNNLSLYDQIKNGVYNFHSSKFFSVSSSAKDLIKKMMTVDPSKRISTTTILRHPWLNDSVLRTKVNKLLGLSDCENISPSSVNNILPNNFFANKRARME
ncbi:serine/threonine-protein kinase Chk2 isoform X2 [Copidosoma floridanum]|uniref:serine/threonine-protein kinase Chk2 isoform X2 n=1 Tax=Copidosoma floridanum TaxID=29053 RepID=UPI0006C9A319|nr:serine/threonine-protein kinase Chk2 isoform X2 [Copidosoma floridanum]